MVGIENTVDLSAEAKKVKSPVIDKAEKERQRTFLAQLRTRKPLKAKAKKKAAAKKQNRMRKAKKGEIYYCTVCGCEIVCTTPSESPIVCCDQIMFVG